jgi:hypothetical protein
VVTSGGKLDALQQRVLEVLSTVEPPFTLGGGGALAGVHLGHRTTRDLATILVDPPRAILVDKLCALLSRSELRDLIDVEALVESGQDLPSAIDDAPRRDSGFSRLTLAWVLRDFDVRSMAVALGYEPATIDRLEAFRQTLIESLIAPGETSKEHSGL